MSHRILLASLGGQPQVVTFTLDALLSRGIVLQEVLVIFPGGNPRYRQAFQRLVREFATFPNYRDITLRCHGLQKAPGRPLPDVLSDGDLAEAWEQIRELVCRLKRGHHQLHISITGGRRALGLMLYAAAMIYGTPQDKVWHIYTPPEWLPKVRDGAQMHLPSGTVRLLEIPFVPWTAYIPGLRVLFETSPAVLQRLMGEGLDKETQYRCAQVWSRLTPRQREALRALATTETRKEAAQLMGIRIDTLDSHRKAILEACRAVGFPERVDLRFVRRVFRQWLASTNDIPTLWGDFREEVGVEGTKSSS